MASEEPMSLAEEVNEVRGRVAARLGELEPLVREYAELVKLADELGIPHDDPLGPPPPAPPAGRRRRTRQAAGPESRPERTQRAPTTSAGADPEADPDRDARVIEALRASPGMTIGELASIVGLPATSLYRPVRELTGSGAVVKRGRGLYAGS